MTVDIRNPHGKALTTSDRSNAVVESLKQFARASRFADRKKGIRAYQTHVRRDPWIPILFLGICVIPFVLGSTYFGLIASDRYLTEARVAIRPAIGGSDSTAADDKSEGGDVGTSAGVPKQLIAQDTLITGAYVGSRAMIEAIAKQMPVQEMFSRDSIDWFSRFNRDKPIEEFVDYWAWRVKASIEPNSGIVTVRVNAFDPAESLALTKSIIGEAERKVNDLSMVMREDAVRESRRELAKAEERLNKVRFAMRDLRNREGTLDAVLANTTNVKMTAELRKLRIELSVQLSLAQRDFSPETRKIQDLKAQIKDIDVNIEKIERASTNEDPQQRRVLANAMTQFEAYTAELEDALKYYAKVLAANEKARIIASRQIEFFSVVVPPVLPQSAEQPRRWLIIGLLGAGCTVLFLLSVLLRKATR